MKMKFVAAAVLLAGVPALAQAQQGGAPAGPKPTLADVQKVVKAIQADKAKLAAYCETAKLWKEEAAADEAKDTKKAEEIGKKAEEAAKKIGDDYMKLVDGLAQVDPESKEGKELASALDPLDSTCGK